MQNGSSQSPTGAKHTGKTPRTGRPSEGLGNLAPAGVARPCWWQGAVINQLLTRAELNQTAESVRPTSTTRSREPLSNVVSG